MNTTKQNKNACLTLKQSKIFMKVKRDLKVFTKCSKTLTSQSSTTYFFILSLYLIKTCSKGAHSYLNSKA